MESAYKKYIKYSPEVEKAINSNLPLVALESTIITHGMEYPQNFNTATLVEKEIKERGAVPATIVIINGVIRIGLTEEEIQEVSINKSHFEKCTTRDLPYIISKKKSGSTTVAATMYLAKLAGIDVFVTGGIGGVHFGDDWDVSADLTELSRTPIIVVCAGIKSILDINRTLEVLETYSVPVIGLKTDTFPEFYFTEGDHKVKLRLDEHKEIAELFNISIDLGLKSGVIVGVPVPKEESGDKELIKDKIRQAIEKANQLKIRGPAITPFLLKEVNDLSKGKSSEANVALIRNNAIQGALISIELVKIRQNKKS